MHRTIALVVALAAVASGCGYNEIPPKGPEYLGQSYPEAIRVLCDVDKLAGIATEEDPLALGRKRTDFIQTHVDNPDGIYLRTLMSVKGPAEQAADLREEAKETGLERCALAEDLEKNGAGGLSP
jgi:hypothetical protein